MVLKITIEYLDTFTNGSRNSLGENWSGKRLLKKIKHTPAKGDQKHCFPVLENNRTRERRERRNKEESVYTSLCTFQVTCYFTPF